MKAVLNLLEEETLRTQAQETSFKTEQRVLGDASGTSRFQATSWQIFSKDKWKKTILHTKQLGTRRRCLAEASRTMPLTIDDWNHRHHGHKMYSFRTINTIILSRFWAGFRSSPSMKRSLHRLWY